MRALFVFLPTESKRLIGKAVANMEEVKKAFECDRLLIAHGTTTVAVAEEVIGMEKLAELMDRNAYVTGLIRNGVLCSSSGKGKHPMLVLNRGVVEPPADTMIEALKDFGADSIFIKGANAVDPEGNAGVLVGHPEGGTIGWAIGMVLARGIRFIVPVGLEKLVPSVRKAVSACGQQKIDYCQGMKVGMIPCSGAKVVTEIEALKILTGVESIHVASGGSKESQGAVTLISEGDEKAVKKAIEIVEAIKGAPSLDVERADCFACVGCSCDYQGRAGESLPLFMRS
jgi:hypothetical protein